MSVGSGAREMASILDTALLQALLLTGQSSAALELLRGVNYCDMKICEEIIRKGNLNVALLELYKCNSLHRQALELLHKLVEESRSEQPEIIQRFKPEDIVEYLKVAFLETFLIFLVTVKWLALAKFVADLKTKEMIWVGS